MDNNNPALVLPQGAQIDGQTRWQSPSNIAIVKYWGKHGNQLPRNASLSMTLSNARTETAMVYRSKKTSGISIDFKFDGIKNEAFEKRIQGFLESIKMIFPFLEQLHLEIDSKNTFPHSSGIASSASGMSALAVCLCDIEQKLFNTLSDQNTFLRKASFVSRLGSGSASRSLYPGWSAWGRHENIEASSDDYAVAFTEVHDVYKGFRDDILIVSEAEKSVSSTAGHALMEGNIYAPSRYDQARQRMSLLTEVLTNGDVEAFGKITEDEALTLHALMMCSNPSYMLIKPETVRIIEEIRSFRANTNVPVYFSLDAGPNIHLMYPASAISDVSQFKEECLSKYYIKCIDDHCGNGASKLM